MPASYFHSAGVVSTVHLLVDYSHNEPVGCSEPPAGVLAVDDSAVAWSTGTGPAVGCWCATRQSYHSADKGEGGPKGEGGRVAESGVVCVAV